MKKVSLSLDAKSKIPLERSHFLELVTKNPNYFGNITDSVFKPVKSILQKTTYEELNCVGYNPETEEMEATFAIKRSVGYSGNLCSNGSFEYMRFYMDFHDGAGFIDQGVVRINVHDIPSGKDCSGDSTFPIIYSATLKKQTDKKFFCNNPILPTLRVILSWNQNPPQNAPNWKPVWGNVKDCDVQLEPIKIPHLIKPDLLPDLTKFLNITKISPNLSVKKAAEIAGFNLADLNAQKNVSTLNDLIIDGKKTKTPASRFAYKSVLKMMKYPTSEITMHNKSILENANIKLEGLIDDITLFEPKDDSKANVDYEELKCLGLDYNTESLVATFIIKKQAGYGGDLCTKGSKEYVSFWIDWEDDCVWKYLDTVEMDVYNLDMKGDHLCYSVSLPLDATHFRKLCNNPNIVKVRSVLSWNTPPSKTDPDKLEYYGNRVDSHVQIKPGIPIPTGKVIPIFNIIGGIDIGHVNNATGLTKSGSFFAYNGNAVPTGAPFGGKIVINGPSFPGHKYRIKVTNLNTGTVSYPNDTFTVVGFKNTFPFVQYTNQSVDANGYYTYLTHDKNTLNVLARFTPGTNDRLLVELEIKNVIGSFSQTIQMDNTKPKIELSVDDNGDCTFYKKGDTITGHYYVSDQYIRQWRFNNTWTGAISGTANTNPLPGNAFSIPTGTNAYPCGAVTLWAEDKTIVNSQSVGYESWTSYNLCLSDS